MPTFLVRFAYESGVGGVWWWMKLSATHHLGNSFRETEKLKTNKSHVGRKADWNLPTLLETVCHVSRSLALFKA